MYICIGICICMCMYFFCPIAPTWALSGAPPFKVAMLLSGGPPSKLPIHHLTRG